MTRQRGGGEAGTDRGPESTSTAGPSVGCATPRKEQSVENCDGVNRTLRPLGPALSWDREAYLNPLRPKVLFRDRSGHTKRRVQEPSEVATAAADRNITSPSARPCQVIERINFSAERVDNPTDEQALRCSAAVD
jgi:hypothetical protein